MRCDLLCSFEVGVEFRLVIVEAWGGAENCFKLLREPQLRLFIIVLNESLIAARQIAIHIVQKKCARQFVNLLRRIGRIPSGFSLEPRDGLCRQLNVAASDLAILQGDEILSTNGQLVDLFDSGQRAELPHLRHGRALLVGFYVAKTL